MLLSIRKATSQSGVRISNIITRGVATQVHQTRGPKKEGDISSVFASLSGGESPPLPARFADIKRQLILDHEPAIERSWFRLLSSLRSEVNHISSTGSAIIPSIDFSDIRNHSRIKPFAASLRRRGAAVIRGVVPESQALQWKREIVDYIAANPNTKGFPTEKPAVFELYWSPGQVKARAHRNVLEAQKFLMSFWHSNSPKALISTEFPVSYADRLRIRRPGDAGFALGAHVDGGSVERWEPDGYGLGGVYEKIWRGSWEDYDPWESSGRLMVESDLYNGAGACSMFRMYQGWLSMSRTGPGEGTLLVCPAVKEATAYYLLRPFFSPKNMDSSWEGFLDQENWQLDPIQSTILQGGTLGCAQELNDFLHPHLELSRSMVHIPEVRPGDYVAWHCDSIHAVDNIHAGKEDSSVMYIPACPLTEANARYLVRQREAFLEGTPGPDLPGGNGESDHIGRMRKVDVAAAGAEEGLRAMGLERWHQGKRTMTHVERKLLEVVNGIVS